MKIGNYKIEKGCKPFIIAEVSCNHKGSIDNAITLIKQAKQAGADAVKFQCYTPDTITLDCTKPDFIIQDGLWKGRTLYELYSSAYTPFDWFPKLFQAARINNIIAFSSVFDASSVEMLERLGIPAYKIASFEAADTPLIEIAAKTNKPLIISTGLLRNKDVLDTATAAGDMACFLHCTSEYPGTVEFSDLNRMERLRQLLGPESLVGISDHTANPDLVPVAATAMGAVVIEKHIKLVGDDDGEDAAFSLTVNGFKKMVTAVNLTWQAMQVRENISNPSTQFRRSLYAVEDIMAGEPFTEHNVRSIRPGYGLPPRQLPKLLGKEADKCYRRGDRIT